MQTWQRISATLTLIVAAEGCQGVAGPQFLRPGNAPTQRVRAQHFDPFPENETGPPIPEARPRDYQRPPPQVTRGRWYEPGYGNDRYGPGVDGSSYVAPNADGTLVPVD